MKQYSLPLYVDESDDFKIVEKIPYGSKEYDEKWIQQQCFKAPQLLPIEQIDQSFTGLVPICCEMGVKSGSIDLIYINDSGLIVLGECKLWRNPEARRKVVGQILDYAKDLSNLTFTEFERLCLKYRKSSESTLYEIVVARYPEIDEARFVDYVQESLRRGRFLLTIIGDGIRENMEELAEYLNSHTNMGFTLALVELPVFRIPSSNSLIITPRVTNRTIEIERIIYKEMPITEKRETKVKEAASIAEQRFFEELEKNIGVAATNEFRRLLTEIHEKVGVVSRLGRGKKGSLNLKTSDDIYNFASIQETGEVWFYGIVSKTEEAGDQTIGEDYLRKLARLVEGQFDMTYKKWYWCIKRSGSYLQLSEYLKVKSEWIDLIDNTLNRIWELDE